MRPDALDLESSLAQQALRDWLADPVDDLDPEVAEALRRQLAGVIEDLPELLAAHLQKLAERARIEESLRRLATSLHGGLTHEKRQSPRGRVDVARTTQRNLEYDGVPFRPVTTRLAEDKPRLVVVADLTRRVRETIWLTPEPKYSWPLGGCDLPAYAESCDRVEAIRDHSGLESWATDVVTRAASR